MSRPAAAIEQHTAAHAGGAPTTAETKLDPKVDAKVVLVGDAYGDALAAALTTALAARGVALHFFPLAHLCRDKHDARDDVAAVLRMFLVTLRPKVVVYTSSVPLQSLQMHVFAATDAALLTPEPQEQAPERLLAALDEALARPPAAAAPDERGAHTAWAEQAERPPHKAPRSHARGAGSPADDFKRQTLPAAALAHFYAAFAEISAPPPGPTYELETADTVIAALTRLERLSRAHPTVDVTALVARFLETRFSAVSA